MSIDKKEDYDCSLANPCALIAGQTSEPVYENESI